MSCPLAGNVAPWIKLMGMPVPTFVQSAFKAVECGCQYCTFGEFIPQINDSISEKNASDVESVSPFVNRQYPIRMWWSALI